MTSLRKLTALLMLIGFTALNGCSAGSGFNASSGKLEQIQTAFPSMEYIEPLDQVSFDGTTLTCTGPCELKLNDTNFAIFNTMTCEGSLVINNTLLNCDDNLTLTK